MSLVEQELLTFREHLSSFPFFTCISEVRVVHFVKFPVFMFLVSCCVILWCFFFLSLQTVLRFMASDYPFGILKLSFIRTGNKSVRKGVQFVPIMVIVCRKPGPPSNKYVVNQN